MKALRTLLLAGLMSAGLYWFYGPWPLPNHPVIDSNVWVARNEARRVYWLDNDRILFLTGEDVRVLGERETGYAPGRRRTLAIWEIGKGVAVYRRNIRWLSCYADGVIRYRAYAEDGSVVEWRGPMGAEQPYHKPDASYQQENEFYCAYLPRRMWRQDGEARRLLRPEHGYLILGPDAKGARMDNTTVHYRPPGTERSIALPFGRRETGFVSYHPFADAYFLYSRVNLSTTGPGVTYWPNGTRQPLWLMSTSGEVTEFGVIQPDWGKGSPKWYHYTRAGIVMIYRSGTRSWRNAGESGAYLVRDGKRDWLIKGYVGAASVSPDGCRMAFTHAHNLTADLGGEKHRRTLKIISLCQGGLSDADRTGNSSAR